MLGFLGEGASNAIQILSSLKKVPLSVISQIVKDTEAFYATSNLEEQVKIVMSILRVSATVSATPTDDAWVAFIDKVTQTSMFKWFLGFVQKYLVNKADPLDFKPQSIEDSKITEAEQDAFTTQSINILLALEIAQAVAGLIYYLRKAREEKPVEPVEPVAPTGANG